MSQARMDQMRQRLLAAFPDAEIRIKDESHLHAGHAGARSGRGHFKLRLRTPALRGDSMIARHRKVYAALGDMMQTDIHALSIDAASGE